MTETRRVSVMTIVSTTVLLAFLPPVRAQALGREVGTTGANFLKLGAGARSAAMAGAAAASVSDATALSWNPAGLAAVPGYAVSTQHASYLGETSYQHLGLALPVHAAGGTAGFEALYQSAGSIARADASGNDRGSFTPYNLALAAGFARRLGSHEAGGALRFIQSKIVGSASTVAADLGTRLSASPRLRLGLSLRHLGPGLKFGQSDPLPTTLQGGAAWRAREGLLLAADVSLPRDNVPALHLGVEGELFRSPAASLLGRAGYGTRGLDVSGMAGLSAGIGTILEAAGGRFGLDYAVAPMGELGVTHLVSLSYAWGGAPRPAAPVQPRDAAPRAADAAPAVQVAEGLIDRRRFDEALAVLEQASRDLPPDDARQARVLERIGRAQLELGRAAEAKDAFTRGILRAGELKAPRDVLADLYAGLGRCLASEGRLPYARRFFERALDASPSPETRKLIEAELKRLDNRPRQEDGK